MRKRIGKNAIYQISFMLLIIWAAMLVFEALVVVIFSSAYVRREIDIRDAEARLFVDRIIYSASGISYSDNDLGRAYPGTVDLRKIDSAFLGNSALMEKNQVLAARVTVYGIEGTFSREAVYNEVWYNRWKPLAGKRGRGASTEILEKRYVAVYDGDSYKGQGILEIRVLVPNA